MHVNCLTYSDAWSAINLKCVNSKNPISDQKYSNLILHRRSRHAKLLFLYRMVVVIVFSIAFQFDYSLAPHIKRNGFENKTPFWNSDNSFDSIVLHIILFRNVFLIYLRTRVLSQWSVYYIYNVRTIIIIVSTSSRWTTRKTEQRKKIIKHKISWLQ